MTRVITPRAGFSILFLGALLSALTLANPTHAAAQNGGPVFDAAELSTVPQLADVQRAVEQIRRSYPSPLRNSGVSGRVQIQAVIGADGRVESDSMEIIHADHDALGQAAMAVVPQLTFRPGQKDGQAVRSRVVIPLSYQP